MTTATDMRRGATNHQPANLHRGIIALLFALAVIAERAATLPAPIRYAILLILRRAEPVAYQYAYWELHGCGLTLQWLLPDECRRHSDANAALSLGGWLRILAISLRDLPRRAFIQKARFGGNRDTSLSMAEAALLARVGVNAMPASSHLPAIRAGPLSAA